MEQRGTPQVDTPPATWHEGARNDWNPEFLCFLRRVRNHKVHFTHRDRNLNIAFAHDAYPGHVAFYWQAKKRALHCVPVRVSKWGNTQTFNAGEAFAKFADLALRINTRLGQFLSRQIDEQDFAEDLNTTGLVQCSAVEATHAALTCWARYWEERRRANH